MEVNAFWPDKDFCQTEYGCSKHFHSLPYYAYHFLYRFTDGFWSTDQTLCDDYFLAFEKVSKFQDSFLTY